MSGPAAIVFVHGLWMNGLELTWLRGRMRKAGFDTHQFEYSSVHHDLAQNVEALFRFAHSIPAEELHFVGYSLGGVVALNMLARFHEQLPPGRAVLIGSPVRGSQAARRLATFRLGSMMLGAAGPGCLDSDHADCWQAQRSLGVIAGRRSIGLGRLFKSFADENDGTVAVTETRLDNADDFLELPLTHATLMFSRDVARATASFLHQGRFT